MMGGQLKGNEPHPQRCVRVIKADEALGQNGTRPVKASTLVDDCAAKSRLFTFRHLT